MIMPLEVFEDLCRDIQAGRQPILAGWCLIIEQADKIKEIIGLFKNALDEYYECCIATRICQKECTRCANQKIMINESDLKRSCRLTMAKIKEETIQMRPDYPGTLKAILVGQARKFKAFALTANSMRNAAFRLNKAGIGEWNIEVIDDHHVLVTRNT